MANETPANGSLFKISISSSFTTLANQVSFTGPDGKKADIDLSNLILGYKPYIVGQRDWGVLTVTGNLAHAEASQAYLITSFKTDAPTIESCKLILADTGAAEVAFSAYINQLSFGQASIDGVIQFTAGFRIAGDVTVTP